MTAASGAWYAHSPTHPPFGPCALSEAWAFLEWRATEDILVSPAAGTFLHAAGLSVGGSALILAGASGSGKSTLAAHLAARGHRAWGDDLVRFAPAERQFSASERSWKLDAKSLNDIELIRSRCDDKTPGTFIAPPNWYVSPAVFCADWRAAPGPATAIVLLDQSRHTGRAVLKRTSEGSAALQVAESLIGADRPWTATERIELMTCILEGLREAVAFAASGGDAGSLADAIEGEFGR